MTRTRTVLPQNGERTPEPGTIILARPDTPETRAEAEATDLEHAEMLAEPEPEPEPAPEPEPEPKTEEELAERQDRNQKFWKSCVLAMLPRHSDEASICEMADTLTREFDRRFEGGWYAHQHEDFFQSEAGTSDE